MDDAIINYQREINLIKGINSPLVFNKKEWNEIELEKITWIVIGDNPGKEEKQECKYFIGQAGKKVRPYFSLLESNKNKILYLNKVPIHTNTTIELNRIETTIIQKYISPIFSLLKNIIARNPKVNIFIMGISKNKLNRTFYKLFKVEKIFCKNIYFGPHFSRNHFQKSRLTKIIPTSNNEIAILKKIDNETRNRLLINFKFKMES